jgi:hypothetical protein
LFILEIEQQISIVDLIPVIGQIAVKAVETITTENLKKWIGEGKSTTAKRLLLDLFENIVVLESNTRGFVALLEEFASSYTDLPKGGIIDPRWLMGWGNLLTRQAQKLTPQMQEISFVLQKLNPQVDIYIPEIADFFQNTRVGFSPIPTADLDIAKMIGSGKVEGASSLKLIISKIVEAVDELEKTKRSLSEFIKGEFSFKEII